MAETPRTALVTGASRGIGRAIALRLAAMGHRVAINYNTHREEAEQTVARIEANGGAAIAVGGDVSQKPDVERIVAETIGTLGPIEILVNNAGIISDGLFVRLKDEAWDRVLQTNLAGTYYCCRLVAPEMLKGRWGRIINITSVVGLRGNAGQTNYSASKSAIHGFTKSLAKELATRHITVNAVAPGYVETATVDGLKQSLKDTILTWIPVGRFGTPEEVAAAACFLATEEARYITGEILRVDGGMAI